MKILVSLIASLVLSGCSVLGLTQPQTLEQKIAYADGTVTAVAQASDQSLLAHKITSAQAERVSVVIHQAIPFLDDAKTASRSGDTAGANRNYLLAKALLDGLQTYTGATTP